MTLQSKLKWFGVQLSNICPRSYHYTKAVNASLPYLVWAEYGEMDDFNADNRKAEQVIGGSVHYFTKTEYDSVIDGIQAMLNDNRLTWRLESVQYEPDTGIIHYEWGVGLGEINS